MTDVEKMQKRIEKLESQVKQLLVRVFELEKGKEVSVGPNVPPLPG